MKTTAPFMAPVINGGSATKTSMGRTFVLVEPQPRQVQAKCNNQRLDPPSIMDLQDMYKYTSTRTDPISRILLTRLVATTVVHHSNIPLHINTIKVEGTITTTSSCQLNVLTLKKQMSKWITYQRVRS